MAIPTDQQVSRRNFLKAEIGGHKPQLTVRPPWSDEASVLAHCTSCSACIDVCPENIVFADTKGQPEIRFDDGECTFCKACASACDEQVFDISRLIPWPIKASVGKDCLLNSGVTCQICTDVCDPEALHFDMRVPPAGAIRLDLEACTGCGACVATCPTSALVVGHTGQEGAA